jgi:hypothetical protein
MTIEGYKPGLQLGYSVYEACNQFGLRPKPRNLLIRELDIYEIREFGDTAI